MKKKIIVPLLLLSSLIVTGCNNNTPSNPSNPDESVSTETNESSDEKPSETTSENKPDESGSEDKPSDPKRVHFNDSNPNAKKVSISTLMAKQKTAPANGDGILYSVTGTMQHVQNANYGNFEITDDTGSMCVWGLSRYSSCIKASGSRYSFTNAKDFKTIGLDGGDEVTIEGIFVVYGSKWKTLEFQGYPVDATINDLGEVTPKKYSEADPYQGSYYDGVTGEGKILGTNLHNLMMNTHKKYTGYNEIEKYFNKADDYGAGKAQCLYTGKTGSHNKEHVWPQSKTKQQNGNQLFGENHAGSDLLHIRPTDHDTNSKRGSSCFAPMFKKESLNKIKRTTGGTNYYGAGTVVGCFEPADEVKGDIARIIAYVFVHYSNEFGGEQDSFTGQLYLNSVMAGSFKNAKALIRLWNAEDPVSKVEITRNNLAQDIQGNRNPFVDHPSYIDSVFNY